MMRGVDEIVDVTAGTIVPTLEPRPSNYDLLRARELLATLQMRKCESLKLYKPLPSVEPFHACTAAEVLVYGSNRAGKTLSVLCEVARAVTGQDPHNKYPVADGRCYFVAMSAKLIAEKIYRTLFRAGPFRMIRDSETKEWRAFQPRNKWDSDNEHLSKPAPPLIPPRFIADIAWENKAQQVPNVIRLTNGWEMLFLTCNMSPMTSVDIDLLVFDEEIDQPLWYSEGAARLVDRRGRFLWSATPQYATEQMLELWQRSEYDDNNRVKSFFMHIKDNIYMAEDKIAAFEAKLTNDADRQVRFEGQFAIVGFKIYSEWDVVRTHGIEPMPIPPSWTRYAVIDPGHDVTAVLFAAVPDDADEHWAGHVILYDELYLKKCSLNAFGEAMEKRSQGQNFEVFIIDHTFSRQHEQHSGRTRESLLEEELDRRNVRPERMGTPFFVWGSSDFDAGILSVREAMRIRPSGTPRLLALRRTLPNFEDEISKYRYHKQGGLMTDRPSPKARDHLMDALRMLMAYDPKYVKPRAGRGPLTGIMAWMKAKDASNRALRSDLGESRSFVHLGPGPG